MKRTYMSENLLSAEVVAKKVDFLTKILLQVPAKSLIRFKCVSKHWLSLISDSKFSNDHMRKNINLYVSGLYMDSHPLYNLYTKSPNGLPGLDFLATSFCVKPMILHSCNGLMLCSCGPKMVVCNLTSQKLKVIPSLSDPSFDSNYYGNFLAFYPMRSPHYKIILVSGRCSTFELSRNNYSCDIDMYPSESGIWKKIHFSKPQFDPFINGVLCDGAIYWAFSGGNLARFDIDEEKLTTIEMTFEPRIFHGNINCLGEYGGHLFLVHTKTPTETEFQILAMDMHNSRWNIKYDINIEPVIDTFYVISNHHSVNVLCFTERDEEKTPILLLIICEKIISYNPMSNCLEILQDLSGYFDEITDFELLCAHNFIESMASM